MDEKLGEQGAESRWRVFRQHEKTLKQIVCEEVQIFLGCCFVRFLKDGLPQLQHLLEVVRYSSVVLLISTFEPCENRRKKKGVRKASLRRKQVSLHLRKISKRFEERLNMSRASFLRPSSLGVDCLSATDCSLRIRNISLTFCFSYSSSCQPSRHAWVSLWTIRQLLRELVELLLMSPGEIPHSLRAVRPFKWISALLTIACSNREENSKTRSLTCIDSKAGKSEYPNFSLRRETSPSDRSL